MKNKDETLQCVVVLYAQVQHAASYLLIAREIEAKGHSAVLYVSTKDSIQNEDRVLAPDIKIKNIFREDIRKLKNINVFISSEIDSVLCPLGAKSVSLHHSLPEDSLDNYSFLPFFKRNKFLLITTDYYVIARIDKNGLIDLNFDELGKKTFPPNMLINRTPNFHVVPGGYPKIDLLRERFSNSEYKKNAILYAPTNISLPFSRVLQDGETIIRKIMELLPDYDFIFRPYPTLKNRDAVSHIKDLFLSNKRFIYDDSPTASLSQEKAIITVSDVSSAALSFSIASLTPYISYMYQEDKKNLKGSGFKHELGYTVRNIKQLLNAVLEALNSLDVWEKNIKCVSNRFVYNPGNTAKYIADNIESFARGDGKSDWAKIERTELTGGNTRLDSLVVGIKELIDSREYVLASVYLQFAKTKFGENNELNHLSQYNGFDLNRYNKVYFQ